MKKSNFIKNLTFISMIMILLGSFLACDLVEKQEEEKKSKKKSNNIPVAVDDTATTLEGTMVSIDALANDTDADADALSIESVGWATNGNTEISEGKINYTPTKGYIGDDTFTYTVTDGKGGTATGNVTVTIEAVIVPGNNSPIAGDDTAEINENEELIMAKAELLENDSDPDGDTLHFDTASISYSSSCTGILTLTTDSIKFTPSANKYGVAIVIYKISDGNGGTATGTITITVNSVNSSPDANDEVAFTKAGQSVDILMSKCVEDPDGDTITITNITNPSKGTVSNEGDRIVYTPTEDFENSFDTFEYTVSDGNGETDSGIIKVAINHAPDATDDSYLTDPDEFEFFNNEEPVKLDVLKNDTDPDNNDILQIISVTQPEHGNVEIDEGSYYHNISDKIVYIPEENCFGEYSFTYTVRDYNDLNFNDVTKEFDWPEAIYDEQTATVTIIVKNPVDYPDSTEIAQSGAVWLQDPDGDQAHPDYEITGAVGQQFTVEIHVNCSELDPILGGEGFASYGIDLVYDDSILEYVNYTVGTNGFLSAFNANNPGIIMTGGFDAMGIDLEPALPKNAGADLYILSITFKVKDDAEAGIVNITTTINDFQDEVLVPIGIPIGYAAKVTVQ